MISPIPNPIGNPLPASLPIQRSLRARFFHCIGIGPRIDPSWLVDMRGIDLDIIRRRRLHKRRSAQIPNLGDVFPDPKRCAISTMARSAFKHQQIGACINQDRSANFV